MDREISIQIGNAKPDENLIKAAKIMGFDANCLDYLWGNVCHIGGYNDAEFRTLCGVGDNSGNWGYAGVGNFDSEKDGCRNCHRRLKKG